MTIRDKAATGGKRVLPKEKMVLSRARCEELLARDAASEKKRAQSKKAHGHLRHLLGK